MASQASATTTVLVTGASGHLGRLTVEALLARAGGAGLRVIAGARDVSKVQDLVAKGAEARAVDFTAAPEELSKAFGGVDRLVLVSSNAIGQRVAQHLAAVQAAKAAGVKHILYTSLPKGGESVMTALAAEHGATEEAIKATGIAYTFLRNNWYFENLLMSLPGNLQRGAWVTSAGAGKVGWVGRKDLAQAAAAAAAEAPKYAGRALELSGTKLWTTEEVAGLASAVLGKPLAVVQVPDEALTAGLKQAGLPEFVVGLLVAMDAGIRDGALEVARSDLLEVLGAGAKPETFEEYLKAHSAEYVGTA